jgi:Fe-S-cluster containining protein
MDWTQAVFNAAHRQDVRERVDGVYADFQRELDQRRPRCDASGRCCRFKEYGHRLYVTTLELAAFVASLNDFARSTGCTSGAVMEGTCPFQVDGLCSVHAIRPFGCRVFFCDPASIEWQNDQYERFHATLRRLHEELDVPYRYLEWLDALKCLGLADFAASAPAPAQSAKKGQPLSLPQLPL